MATVGAVVVSDRRVRWPRRHDSGHEVVHLGLPEADGLLVPEQPRDLPAAVPDDDQSRRRQAAAGDVGREVGERPVDIAQRAERAHDQMAPRVAARSRSSSRAPRSRSPPDAASVSIERLPTRMISPAYPRSSNCRPIAR